MKIKKLYMNEQILQQKLPDDLIAHHIITKLPLKDVIRFKSVSKEWYSTLSSSEFAHLYAKLSRFSQPSPYTRFLIIKKRTDCYILCHDDGEEEITRKVTDCNKNLFKLSIGFDENLVFIGSCNGLVCLASSSSSSFVLWNPITGQVQEYKDHELVIDFSSPCKVAWGFGYVLDDYKIVRMLQWAGTQINCVHVFSLKSNKWTRIADELYQDIFSLRPVAIERFSVPRDPISFGLMKGVLVDETIYWIVHNVTGYDRKVVSFDLVLEEFNTVADFKLRSDVLCKDKFLCEIGGCLSTFRVKRHKNIFIEMLKSNGKKESISLHGDLHISSCEDIVGFTKTGKFFVLLGNFELGLVDLCSKPMKYEQLFTFDWREKSSITDYFPTLTYLPPLATLDP